MDRRPLARHALVFAAIFGGAAAVGYVPYRLEVRAARHELQRKILAVGRLKAREVERWLSERREDIRSAASGPRIALDIEEWRRRGHMQPATLRWVRGRLQRFETPEGIAEVLVVARDGAVLLAAGAPEEAARALRRDLALRAMSEERVVLSAFREPGGAEAGAERLDLFAPLYAVDDRGTRVVGALVYRIDPSRQLYPMVTAWPTDSPSAEALLAERDGDSVRYLNELRHAKGAAPPRVPLSDSDVVSAKGLLGARGMVEGTDYRGVQVLAWVDEVAGTPWVLVSKIDQADIYAPLRAFVWTYVVFLAAAAFAGAAAVRLQLRAAREAALQREHERTKRYVEALETSKKERERLIASLSRALEDVKTLRGIVPICSACKRIRDDEGYWRQVESYVSAHTEAQFSHGVCPECARRLYPEFAETPAPPKPG